MFSRICSSMLKYSLTDGRVGRSDALTTLMDIVDKAISSSINQKEIMQVTIVIKMHIG
jgi:hypothetical protein